MHGPLVTHLTYPAPPDAAASAPAGEPGPTVALEPLEDLRREPRSLVGVALSGNGKHAGDAMTPDDAPAWAAGALRSELARLGVRVVDGGAPRVLRGQLTLVRCDAFFTYSGRVTLRAWLDEAGPPLDRTYEGRGTDGLNFGPTAAGYERCLADALRDAATRIAADTKTVLLGGALPPVPPPPDKAAASPWMTPIAVVVAEGIFASFSGLAARWPTETGWTLATAWPVGLINLPAETTGLDIGMAGANFVGIGLYNALELRGERYSRTRRFWLNMGAWHAAFLVDGAVSWLVGPRPAAKKVAVGVGAAAGGPALVVGGGF